MSAMKRRGLIVGGISAALLAGSSGLAIARGWHPRGREVRVMLPQGQSNPAIATGVATGGEVALYQSSGLGPSALNPSAPPGTPESYTDPAQTAGATGVTITEAQALLVLRNIVDNLALAGLSPSDVLTMKCYLTKAPGAPTADYPGWNRAYRQYFANIDLKSHEVIPVPMGTSPAREPLTPNKARPARATMEVASLAVPGWLVEVEVTAAYG